MMETYRGYKPYHLYVRTLYIYIRSSRLFLVYTHTTPTYNPNLQPTTDPGKYLSKA